MPEKKKKRSVLRRVIFFVVLIGFISGAIAFYFGYKTLYQPNLVLQAKKTTHLYIPTGSTFDDVKNQLYEKGYIINRNSFEFFAEKKNYINNVKAGRYLIKDNMSNNQLINMLRAGLQDPVRVSFIATRSREKFVGIIAGYLELDSLSLLNLLNDNKYLSEFGFSKKSSLALFIPNTYEFYWNTSADEFVRRMHKEYKKFWTDDRRAKAKKANLSPMKVSILASIIQEETNKYDEMPRMAGVYINRLNKNMMLQADPTVKFAVGDFSIKRVLNRHKEVVSPYNTYKVIGLPPGPITMPDSRAIDAVLNYESHNYYYFCAKDDMSGYHVFAKSLRQHNINANKYHRKLNQLGIR